MEKDFAFKHEDQKLDQALQAYVTDTFQPEDSALEQARIDTEAAGIPLIQVGKMDGLHLEVLARSCGATRAVEVGTLGGYSGICIARGLPQGGKLYTLEINEDNAHVARKSFERADLGSKVEVIVGPALESLPTLEDKGPFDLVFIDADKANYPHYLKWAESNLRVGGLVIGDNTLGYGKITNETFASPAQETSIKAIREFNQYLASSPNFRSTLIPTGEGLTVGVKIK